MKKIKPILQRDLKDCGVCSMEWIIEYYDGYVSLEKLREDTCTSINGTTAYHIVEAFKKWGFDSVGVLVNDLLSPSVKFPCIAHLSLKNGLEHFVVIKEISKNTIYIMDPGVGDIKWTIKYFSELWTGHLIMAYPREKIIKMEKEIHISDLFIKIIRNEKSLVKKVIATSMIWTILLIISSYYLKIASALLTENSLLLKIIIIIFGIVIIIKVWSLFVRSYYENHLSNLVDTYIYPEFIRHLFFLPLKSIKSRTTGEIITRVSDLSNIKSLFSDIFVTVVLDSLMILISGIILLTINTKLFAILIIFIIIYSLIGIIVSKIMFKKIMANISYQTDFNGFLVEAIEMFESVKNLNCPDIILNVIENKLSKYLLSNYEFVNFFNKSNFVKESLLELCLFLINSLGIWLVYSQKLAIIDLFTFNIIISYCLDPVKNIINMLPKYNYIKATFKKIEEFIELEEEKINSNSVIDVQGDIVFSNVGYSYNNYDYLINDCNLTIKKGSHVLLNGPSGIGKSTICKLIYKEMEPTKGNIMIGNNNTKDLDMTSIRNSVLYIGQNEEIFTGSIRDNIVLNRKISENEFQTICDLCEIEEIVSKKEMRFNSLIDPSSKTISGGEKQRIVLARGLLKRANIIILDEALSEVDEMLETKIIGQLRKHFQDKTIIYISHKNQVNNFNETINLGVKNELLQN